MSGAASSAHTEPMNWPDVISAAAVERVARSFKDYVTESKKDSEAAAKEPKELKEPKEPKEQNEQNEQKEPRESKVVGAGHG